MTNDVCEECWGSGDTRCKWVNLRTLPSKAEYDKCVNMHDELVAALELSLDHWKRCFEKAYDGLSIQQAVHSETYRDLQELRARAKGES